MYINNFIARMTSFLASTARWISEKAILHLVTGAPPGKTGTVPATDKAPVVNITVTKAHGLYVNIRIGGLWDY